MLIRRSQLPQHCNRLLRPTYAPSLRRTFHVSHSHQNVLIDTCHSVFQDVHTWTGLSWTLSIPLTGALFRLGFAPIQYLSMRTARRKTVLAPLLAAESNIMKTMLQANVNAGNMTAEDARNHEITELRSRRTQQNKKYGIPSVWRTVFVSCLFLPVWIINVGVLQAMSGRAGGGLLGRVVDPASLPPAEAAFHAEGFLHITDLSTTDPYLMMPLVFSALMFIQLNIAIPRARLEADKERVLAMPDGANRLAGLAVVQLQQLVKLLPGLSILASPQIPVAMYLYLCGSAAAQTVISQAIKKLVHRKEKSSGMMVHKSAQLKREYRDTMLQMDKWKPPTTK